VRRTTIAIDHLVLAVAQGDVDAFEEVYDAMSPIVYGLALRVVRDPARAEEVAQEAFVEFWRKAAEFDPQRGSARAWMVTIAHRRAVDVVRSEEASRARAIRAGHRMLGSGQGDPVADTVETLADQDRVNRALIHLTPLERQAIELAYYEGQTYRQVAERLDAPIGTIKTRMRSALQRLGDILGADE
jgi:RNA polymerase sigma-70 factor (ECF subfamily)